ncbi:MAG: hypothetical protein PHE10_01035 [Kiritimatiellae bacterium]|nr:hypothetical protein [Kiritimatiellia bacterium]
MNKMTLVGLLALTSFVAVAKTNYVDCVNGVDDTSYGTAEDNAWATLNYAVDNSSAGDTVIVLPGVYTNGVSSYSRLNITKQLRFESRDGRDKTFIVGSQAEFDATVDEPNSNCVRCVRVTSGAAGTIVKGFTLTGGGQIEGGGANFSGASYLVDCVCSNNIATRGAAVMNGTIIRCLVTENLNRSATYGTSLYNCVITRNYGAVMCLYPGKIVSCTFIENWDPTTAYACVRYNPEKPIYNTLFLYNRSDCHSGKVWSNCVTSVAAPFGTVCSAESGAVVSNVTASAQLAAPPLGDWRPLAGSETATAGNADWLGELTVPEEFRYVDYYGHPIPQSGVIAAGAAQEVVTPQGGSIVLDGIYKMPDGRDRLVSGMVIHATDWPMQIKVKAESSRPIFCYTATGGYPTYRFPEKDGSLWVMPPVEGEMTLTATFATEAPFYVDKETGDDSNDGRSAVVGEPGVGPKRTIQGAVDAAPNGAIANCSVIYVAPGDYDEGGAFMYGITNRICVTNKSVRIVATGSAAETIIRGAEDPNAAPTAFGCGPAAVRCLAFYEIRNALQGFTLTDGHSDLYTGSNDGKHGGAFYTQQERPSQIADCIISNNVGQNAAVGNSGWFVRCRIGNNRVLEKGNNIFYQSTLSACVIGTNIFDKLTKGVVGGSAVKYSRAWHCTIRGLGGDVSQGAVFYGGPQVVNSVVTDFYNTDMAVVISGCVCHSFFDYYESLTNGFVNADPRLVARESDDYRPLSVSPAIGAGVADDADYHKWVTSDVNGSPIQFTNGRPTAGAYQKPLLTLRTFGKNIDPSAGDTPVEPGASVDVTATAAATHSSWSWIVNDITNRTGLATWTVTAEDRAYGKDEIFSVGLAYDPNGTILLFR